MSESSRTWRLIHDHAKPEPFDLEKIKSGQMQACLADGETLTLQNINPHLDDFFQVSFSDTRGRLHHCSLQGKMRPPQHGKEAEKDEKEQAVDAVFCRSMPAMIVNGNAISGPLMTAPPVGKEYWIRFGENPERLIWEGSVADEKRLASRQCFATENDVLAFAGALDNGCRPQYVQLLVAGNKIVVASDADISVRLAWLDERQLAQDPDSLSRINCLHGDKQQPALLARALQCLLAPLREEWAQKQKREMEEKQEKEAAEKKAQAQKAENQKEETKDQKEAVQNQPQDCAHEPESAEAVSEGNVKDDEMPKQPAQQEPQETQELKEPQWPPPVQPEQAETPESPEPSVQPEQPVDPDRSGGDEQPGQTEPPTLEQPETAELPALPDGQIPPPQHLPQLPQT